MKQKVTVFWFRRDLRFFDNAGFYHALKSGNPVLPVFIFDTEILDKLNNCSDARVSFIYAEIQKLKIEFEKRNSSLDVFYSKPLAAFQKLTSEFKVHAVYTNKDYEPYAIQRDEDIERFLMSKGIRFHSFKDHILFEENEVLKDNHEPYTVFTPYSKKWKQMLADTEISHFPSEKYLDNLLKINSFVLPELKEIGFKKSEITVPPAQISEKIIEEYAAKRDLPAVEGTTRLGVHLRFGTVSIRLLTQRALELSEVFLNELIWRNF
ncbi:MAG TPA: deoxyribodipyrimidine photo-lyase, partial [Draconibacterium sp.]|nr:deoxyribodipyrimidine photo-lyase [Draconibacterium sp.]